MQPRSRSTTRLLVTDFNRDGSSKSTEILDQFLDTNLVYFANKLLRLKLGKKVDLEALKGEIETLSREKESREKTVIESKKEIQLITHNITELFNEIKYAKSTEELEKKQNNTIQ